MFNPLNLKVMEIKDLNRDELFKLVKSYEDEFNRLQNEIRYIAFLRGIVSNYLDELEV